MILSSRCFLLLVGDDGALLFPPGAMKGLGPLPAATHSEADATPLLQALRQHPQTPVVVLADTGGQQIQIETLPPVSRLDRRKIVQRRLDKTFAARRFKTAWPLGRERSVLLAVDETDALALWLKRLSREANPAGGIASLPLEACTLLSRLRPHKAKGWDMLILWQRCGGFRQIVTLDGQLVFTRLAAQLPDSTSPQSALGFIAVDIQATQGYLARYGLPTDQPPRLTAILPPELGDAFAATFADRDCLVLTPHEAALRLNLTPVFKPAEPFCDPLCASWVAASGTFRRLMMLPDDRRAATARLVRQIGRIAATLALIAALAQTALAAKTTLSLAAQERQLAQDIATLQAEETQTRAHLVPTGQPLGRLRLAVQKRRFFMQNGADDPAGTLQDLARLIGGNAYASGAVWKNGSWHLALSLATPPSADPQTIVDRYDALARMIEQAGYNVRIVHYPFPALPDETVTNAPTPNAPAAQFEIGKGMEAS